MTTSKEFLTAKEVLAGARRADNLYQIFVITDGGDIRLVYLDTTTQHLVYSPPVGTSIIGPAQNYSSIFVLTAEPERSEGIVIRNYVTPTLAPRLTPLGIGSQPGVYRIKMEVPYPGTTPPPPEYQTFNIHVQDVDTTQQIVSIKALGQDIFWCPINENSQRAGDRLVSVRSMIGMFKIMAVSQVFNIHPPLPLPNV